MLEWTGERFLPWIKEPALAYEHIHRYAYALSWVRGKKVLDLASGEGYGSNLLASVATQVVGVDIDEAAVHHAREKYQRPNLQFLSASVTRVPISESHIFDAVTCFETIEHIENQTELLAEIKRLLKPDGILIVSTPNKAEYDLETPDENPFHLRELDFPEFKNLIGKYFRHSRFFGQRIFANSGLWPLDAHDAPINEFVMKRQGTEFDFVAGDPRVPLYYLAVASDVELPGDLGGSVLVDSGNELLLEKVQLLEKTTELEKTKADNETSLAWRAEQIVHRDATIQELEKANAWHAHQIKIQEEGIEALRHALSDQAATIASQQSAIAHQQSVIADKQATTASQQSAIAHQQSVIADRQATIASQQSAIGHQQSVIMDLQATVASHERALDWRARQVDELQRNLENALGRLGSAIWKLEEIQESGGWNFVLRVRKCRDSLFPEGSLRRKALTRIIRLVTVR